MYAIPSPFSFLLSPYRIISGYMPSALLSPDQVGPGIIKLISDPMQKLIDVYNSTHFLVTILS